MKMNRGLENANKMVLAYKEKTEDIMVCKPVKRRLQGFFYLVSYSMEKKC